jgi:hypothetical protein
MTSSHTDHYTTEDLWMFDIHRSLSVEWTGGHGLLGWEGEGRQEWWSTGFIVRVFALVWIAPLLDFNI